MLDVPLIAVDIWAWLAPAVFLLIYLLNHLLANKDPAARQREAQQRRRAAPPGERPLNPKPQPPQPQGQAQLNAEIEQFLKRANERRLEKARRADPVRTPIAAPKPAAPPPPREKPVDVVPLEHRDFDSVAASVEQHLGGRGFNERAAHMVDDIVEADEERARHLKQVFEHRLGNLDSGAAIARQAPADVEAAPLTREDPAATAKALAGILANQQNIRQAIVLKEILERPVDRW
jgi:hypothetical protein